MIEVRNKERGPIQLVVRSRTAPRKFTTQIVPGVGSGKNVVYIADERMTEYVERAEKKGHITTKYVKNLKKKKGDK